MYVIVADIVADICLVITIYVIILLLLILQALQNQLIQDKAAKLEAAAQRHRLNIINGILTLQCPHCNVIVVDFTACFAVEHLSDQEKQYQRYTTNQGCGHWFCGWCFKECVGGQDCHQHVKQCSVAPPHQRGGYHGTMLEFNQVHAAARRTKVLHYLQHNVPDEAEKSKLREVLAADLRDLGIKL